MGVLVVLYMVMVCLVVMILVSGGWFVGKCVSE